MRPALDLAGHRVPRTKPICLLHTWKPRRRRHFTLVLHLHRHQSSRNLHLQYLAKNPSTQRCQSLITQGSDHPPVLEPHMVLIADRPWTRYGPSACWSAHRVVLLQLTDCPPVGSGLSALGPRTVRRQCAGLLSPLLLDSCFCFGIVWGLFLELVGP
jgi:hypothetical protein